VELARLIRDVPDFPKKGIVFKDITPLWRDPAALAWCVDRMAEFGREQGAGLVAGIESRGFIMGGGVAKQLGAGFVPIRKRGKLPWERVGVSYALEYGEDTVEMHRDAVERGQKVLLVDDLLATGGTAAAAAALIRKMGGEVVGAAFIVELAFLRGRDRLDGVPVRELIRFDG
jgi:adenine phosphoribosyltransferase